MKNAGIREANENDTLLILDFIKQLSIYEKLPNEVKATEEILHNSLFIEKRAKVIFAIEDGKEVGFALYFYNFSTFMGRPGLYLEDLFVLESHRGKGYGKMLLSYLANIAIKENCTRFEWIVLDWNTPSINFYKSFGAVPLEDWTVFRLDGENLQNLANKYISN
ncbi:MAG: acetyltransferase, family [Bacteroidetes bacterium]|nr:acetyltransferase, family [Bacteroidota bacterium]